MNSRRAALESLALVGTLAQIAIAAWGLGTLPDSIAVHWGLDGVGYGPKLTLLLLPACGVFTYLVSGFAASASQPRVNLPMKITITPENRAAVNALKREMVLVTKAALGVGFAAIEWQLVSSARGTLSPGFIPTIIGFSVLVLALTTAYTVAIAKAAKPQPE